MRARPLSNERGTRSRRAGSISTSFKYSSRARRGTPVSTPLKWDELKSDLDPRQFTMDAVLKRVKKFGDLFRVRNKISLGGNEFV